MLTRPQQIKLVGVVIVVLVAIILAAFFAFRRTYTLLRTSDHLEISNMAADVHAAGVRYRIDRHGTELWVDQRYTNEARIAITQGNSIPNPDHFTWDDAFDLTGMGTTESDRNNLARLAQQGQAAAQLMVLSGVHGAWVTFTLPDSRPFDLNAPVPTASVVIEATREFTAQEARNMAQTVAHNAVGLTIENVHIMDQNARSIWTGDLDLHQNVGDVAAARQEQHTNMVNILLNSQLGQYFDITNAFANLVYDDRLFSEDVAELFTAPEGLDGAGIPSVQEWRRAGAEGMLGGFAPGLGWNAGVAYMMGDTGTTSAYERESATQYLVNSLRTITQTGPGWVIPELSSVSATVTRLIPVREELWMAQDPERTQADWIMYQDMNRHPILVNDSFAGFEAVVLNIAAAANVPAQNVNLLVWERMDFIPADVQPLNIPLIIMLIVLFLLLLMLAYGLLHRQKVAAEDEDAEPELSVEDLLVSTQMEEAKDEAAAELEAIDYHKENEVKKQIEKFVNEKPEAVAALLRNWINIEEW